MARFDAEKRAMANIDVVETGVSPGHGFSSEAQDATPVA